MILNDLRKMACLVVHALVFWAACHQAAAEVIAVPGIDAKSPPTQTMYWEGRNSTALLVLIPGGDGQLHLKPTQVTVGNQFYLTFKQLTLGPNPNEIFDVVLFDSPVVLENSKSYPMSRATADHMSRIDSVIQFYKKKTQKPVWLMGHSNGAISVTEYLRYEKKRRQDSQLAGLIVSGARKLAYFDSTPLNLPILFMSHRLDGCPDGDPIGLLANSKKVQGLNKAKTSFVFIESGGSEGSRTCESGYHMYNGATDEVVRVLRNFIVPRDD